MQAGRLRDRITIEQVSTSDDAYGQPIETWSTYATRWASVMPVSGKEYYNTQQVNAEITTRVEIRHDASVYPEMRIAYGTRTLEVNLVHQFDYQDRTVLFCKEFYADIDTDNPTADTTAYTADTTTLTADAY